MSDLFGSPADDEAVAEIASELDLAPTDNARPMRVIDCPVCSRVTRVPAVAPSRTTAVCSVCLDAGVTPGRLF